MTVVNCPLCQLRFTNRNERDWHLRNEHQHLHAHPPTERPLTWAHRVGTTSGGADHATEPATEEDQRD